MSANRYARIDLVATGDFPVAVELNGTRVCGEEAKRCPRKVFGGGSSVLSLDVDHGRQEFVMYELRQTNGSNYEEVRSNIFTVEVDEPGAKRCGVETGECETVSTASPSAATASSAVVGQCRLNSDCGLGEGCRYGRCGPICVEDRDCQHGDRCVEGPDGHAECLAGENPTTSLPQAVGSQR